MKSSRENSRDQLFRIASPVLFRPAGSFRAFSRSKSTQRFYDDVRRNMKVWIVCALLGAAPLGVMAATQAPSALDLSLEELLQVNVVSASRKEQRLQDVAAAVFVVTREDIERSGATSIPDALRMVPGMQVAKLGNGRWAVSARGFNGRFSNKLLVLMDGRSIYSPLFSGVIWEAEDTLLEDIDRIEVIRGSGASMWGANAVNGVINIITRHARETQGSVAIARVGTEERGMAAFRHGGEAWGGHFRVWGKTYKRDEAVDWSGDRASDYGSEGRIGFRGDWQPASGNRFILTGGAYNGRAGDRWDIPDINAPLGFITANTKQSMQGAHLLARHEWKGADGSESKLQGYIENSELNMQDALLERRNTLDLDFQQRLRLGDRHDVVWGAGYRYSQDRIRGQGLGSVSPYKNDFSLISAFIHDEMVVIPEKLRLIAGVRLEHNSYTGFEPQPNLRLLWTPSAGHSFWAAASRAVRTPSRLERDSQFNMVTVPATAYSPPVVVRYMSNQLAGDVAEKVTTFEAGYRHQIGHGFSADLSLFRSLYDRLRSAAFGTPVLSSDGFYILQPVIQNNTLKAYTHGLELALDYRPTPWWRLQPSYSWMHLSSRSLTGDPWDQVNADLLEGRTPVHQFSLRSSMMLAKRQQLDLWLRHVSKLKLADSLGARVPSYTTLDLRYAWRPVRGLELSVVGQNLLRSRHAEFAPDLLPSVPLQIERSLYVQAKWQF